MTTVFFTGRLRVRQFVTADAAALHGVCGNRRTMRLVGDGRVLSREDCARWIGASLTHYAALGHGAWALCLADKDMTDKAVADEPEIIGYCGIVPARRRSDPEIIYALSPAWWGQGLASELVPALLNHGFAACGLRRLMATVRPENVASVRVLERAGMHCTGEELETEGISLLVYALDAP